ncbi:MAG: hypothetical protein WBM28_07235, partial [Burkholderiales bacterium]
MKFSGPLQRLRCTHQVVVFSSLEVPAHGQTKCPIFHFSGRRADMSTGIVKWFNDAKGFGF